jgi:hypothetical protein
VAAIFVATWSRRSTRDARRTDRQELQDVKRGAFTLRGVGLAPTEYGPKPFTRVESYGGGVRRGPVAVDFVNAIRPLVKM